MIVSDPARRRPGDEAVHAKVVDGSTGFVSGARIVGGICGNHCLVGSLFQVPFEEIEVGVIRDGGSLSIMRSKLSLTSLEAIDMGCLPENKAG